MQVARVDCEGATPGWEEPRGVAAAGLCWTRSDHSASLSLERGHHSVPAATSPCGGASQWPAGGPVFGRLPDYSRSLRSTPRPQTDNARWKLPGCTTRLLPRSRAVGGRRAAAGTAAHAGLAPQQGMAPARLVAIRLRCWRGGAQ